MIRTIEEKILDIWASHCDGEWHHFINLKDHTTGVELSTLEGNFRFKDVKEAANDCLYTIGEWLKEV